MPRDPGAVVVIGGGVVGCSVAYRLAREGVAVTLLERSRPGAGATGTSAGNVQPWYDDGDGFKVALGAESLRLHRRFLPDIKEASGIDPMDQEVRYFNPALSVDEEREVRGYIEPLTNVGLRVGWIDAAEAREMEPRLSPAILGGVLHEDCVQIDAQRFVSALAGASEKWGARIRQAEVMALDRKGSKVTGVRLADGTKIGCDTVVLAMGAWVGQAASDWLGTSVPTEPYPLQKLHLRIAGASLGLAVRWGGINMVQRRDGLLHAGSKPDATGFEARPTAEGRDHILKRMSTILPGLDVEVAQAGAAVACSTPGRNPIVGLVGDIEGVYLASVADDGFLLSAGVAEVLTQLLVSGEDHPLLEQLLPQADG